MDPGDLPAVGGLYAEVFGQTAHDLWQRRWRWQFVETPATRYAPARCWVGEVGGDVAGFLASFPARCWIHDREETIYYPCDLMVTPRAAGFGLGFRLVSAYRDAPGNLLPNALQYSAGNGLIHDLLRYRRLEVQPVAMRPYSTGALRRALFGAASLSGWDWAAWLPRIAAAGQPVVHVAAVAARAWRRPARSRALTVTRESQAGPEFDQLWREARTAFAIVPVRDRAWIAWRYFADPLTRHELLLARDAGRAPLGYAAVSTATRRGITVGRIMDLFAPPGRPDVVRTLVAEALAILEQRRVDVVACLGLHPALRRTVRRYLFLTPQRWSVPARVLWSGDPERERLVYDPASWHLSYADGDEAFT